MKFTAPKSILESATALVADAKKANDHLETVPLKKVQKLGWKKQKKPSSSCLNIYISKCGNFVLKNHYFTVRNPRSKYILHGIKIERTLDPDYHGCHAWILQPKVNISASARSIAFKKLRDLNLSKLYDLHIENVGLYRGKPVIFDW